MSAVLDVVVIGSGHNALVAAAYLVKAGRSVEVLERDSVIGGAVSTVERFPGHLVDRGSSAHIMIRHTGIIEDLELDRFGLRYLDLDPWAFAPAPGHSNEPALVFYRDIARTVDSIERACGSRDAAAYREFVRVWGPRSARVMKAFGRPPAPPQLMRSFWGLEHPDGPTELSRQFLATGNSLLDEYFDNERLKAALAWFGAQSGPPMSEPGTAPMVGFAALMHTLPPGRAIGGSGALTQALAARIRADGGVIRESEGAASIRSDRGPVHAGQAPGWRITTTTGRELRATNVVAGCHVLTTLDLLDEADFSDGQLQRWRRGMRVGSGIGMVVRARTTGLPDYPSAETSEDATTGLGLLVTDRSQLARAHASSQAGQLPGEPAVLAMSFSAIDPTLCPTGEHQLSLWAQWHPHTLASGQPWSQVREQAADAITAQVDTYAPGFGDLIADRYIQTPDLLESEMGLIGGNVMHIEMSIDQMMLFRPRPDLAGYRVPGAPGLYLTGASTHPGGGVSGASGRTVAKLVLRDRRNPLRWFGFRGSWRS